MPKDNSPLHQLLYYAQAKMLKVDKMWKIRDHYRPNPEFGVYRIPL